MSWQHIRGHDSLIQAFDQAVRRGRLAHAYLFVGPAGVGKRLFAGELAKALLCAQGMEVRALIERLASLSGGSLGKALALADPKLWEFRRTLLYGLTQPRPDGIALAQEWTKFAEEAGKEMAAQRRRAGLALQLLIDFLNDALSLSLGKSPQLSETAALPLLHRMARQADVDHLLAMIDRCLEADVKI